jgi:hypothetical protein
MHGVPRQVLSRITVKAAIAKAKEKQMKIVEVNVSAGRTFNHPHEQYSNLRPSVNFKAVIEEGDDPIAATKELQRQAESLVEDHKQNMLKSLEDLYELTERQREMTTLEQQLGRAQSRLDDIRKTYPKLQALPGLAESTGE